MYKPNSSRILSFKYAGEGILAAFKQEPNLKFHFLAGFGVLLFSYMLKISRADWVIVILLIGFVISVELTNTAIEGLVNAFINTQHQSAKLIKDISAGAVLAASITAFIVGLLTFLPYLSNLV